jgi:hypothetical protein
VDPGREAVAPGHGVRDVRKSHSCESSVVIVARMSFWRDDTARRMVWDGRRRGWRGGWGWNRGRWV